MNYVGVPTVRESDGFAMSSRYRRLNLRERAFAPCLFKALLARQRANRAWRAERRGHQGTRRTSPTCCPGHQDEYFDLVDPETIRPIDVVEGPVRAALAVWIGETRLIDNVQPGSAH